MRKIGILSIASPDDGGVYQYTLSLLEAVKFISGKFKFVQIRYPDFPKILEDDVVIYKNSSINLKIRQVVHVYFDLVFGNLAPKVDVDLIISPSITLLPFHMKKQYIVTIHDFQHEYYPEFFSFKEKISRKVVYKTGQKASLVICESNYVKQDVIRFLKVPDRKIKVLPAPPPRYIREVKISEDKLEQVRGKYSLPSQYLFYPAQFWYHKNHIKLLESIKLIKSKYNISIPVIFVGSKKNNFENVMKKIHELGLSKQIKYLGYVPQEDMPYLYKLSTALVMPTLFESVSIPIWEAFYLGVPVVSSNVCALPEQVGDAGLLFDPNNIEDMAEKILTIWTNEELRIKLSQRGYERVKGLTIENYATQWRKILEEIINGKL